MGSLEEVGMGSREEVRMESPEEVGMESPVQPETSEVMDSTWCCVVQVPNER
jgi:hypothetical protein